MHILRTKKGSEQDLILEMTKEAISSDSICELDDCTVAAGD
jgi:hypothetical protein